MCVKEYVVKRRPVWGRSKIYREKFGVCCKGRSKRLAGPRDGKRSERLREGATFPRVSYEGDAVSISFLKRYNSKNAPSKKAGGGGGGNKQSSKYQELSARSGYQEESPSELRGYSCSCRSHGFLKRERRERDEIRKAEILRNSAEGTSEKSSLRGPGFPEA